MLLFRMNIGNGNKIPAIRFDPLPRPSRIISPLPTRRDKYSNGIVHNNYIYTSPSSNPFTKYFGRLDYQINPSNRITVTESEGDNPGESFGAGICPIGCQSNDVSKNNAQISDVWDDQPAHDQRSSVWIYQPAELL